MPLRHTRNSTHLSPRAPRPRRLLLPLRDVIATPVVVTETCFTGVVTAAGGPETGVAGGARYAEAPGAVFVRGAVGGGCAGVRVVGGGEAYGEGWGRG